MAVIRDYGISEVSFLASEDLSSYQYYFVETSGSGSVGQVALANSGSATYAPIGILQNKPTSDVEAAVRIMGESKLVCAAPGTRILYGHWVTTNASGQGVYTATASVAVAIAMENADSSASCIIGVLLLPGMSWLTRKV